MDTFEKLSGKLLFTNFTVSHGAPCCKDSINGFHVVVTVPERIEDAEPDVERKWTEEVNIFLGTALQDAFNRMLAQAQNNAEKV